jgi:hypothetical protein
MAMAPTIVSLRTNDWRVTKTMPPERNPGGIVLLVVGGSLELNPRADLDGSRVKDISGFSKV